MAKKKMLGIVIGSAACRIAVCDGDRVIDYVEEPVPEHMTKEGRLVSPIAAGEFIAEVLKKNKIRVKDAAFVLPNEVYYVRRVSLPLMTIQQLKVNLPYSFKDYLSGEPADYVFDYAVLGKDEKNLDLMAAACGKDIVQSYMELCARAKLRLVKLVPDVIALNAILTRHDPAKDYVVMDMGHAGTRIHFYTKGVYEITRTLQTSADAIVQLIAENQGIDEHIAWFRMANNENHCLEDPEVADLLSNLAAEISRVINFYNYNNPQNTIEEIYIIGDVLPLNAIEDVMKENMDLPVKTMEDILPEEAKNVLAAPAAYGAVIE